MAGKPPIFRVSFDSYDDFLVEFGDHLRQDTLVIPRPDGLAAGEAVRIKLILPNETVLYLVGTTREDAASFLAPDEEPKIEVNLNPLTEKQRKQLDICVQGALESQAGRPVTDEELDAEPMNLLLVDDSVTVRIELGDALRERGVRVRVAENGLVAIAAALKRPPDLILSDVEMPVMDGWAFLRMARSRKRLNTIPFVFFTRLTDDLSRLQGYRMGVEDYLPKELSPEEILARLRAVLARHTRTVATASNTQGLRGDLRHVRLGSLLSFIESEKRTGALHLTNGIEEVILHLDQGALASVDNLGDFNHPHDRVFELLDWPLGDFEFVSDAQPPRGATDLTPVTYLLMEHARRADEAAGAGR